RNAYVVQLSDKAMTKQWLLHERGLGEVKPVIEELARHHRKLGVLTTLTIRRAITGETDKKLPVFTGALGARIGHYGNLRGTNEFADCDALVILRRQQRSPRDIGELRQQIFYRDRKPLAHPPEGKAGNNISAAQSRRRDRRRA